MHSLFYCCIDEQVDSLGVGVHLVSVDEFADDAGDRKDVQVLGPIAKHGHTKESRSQSYCCAPHEAQQDVIADLELSTSEEVPVVKERAVRFDGGAEKTAALIDASADMGAVLREFNVKVHRSEQKKLGMRVDYQDEAVLRVVEIKPDSLITSWNAQHPTMQVSKGDCVMSVNDKRGSSSEMLEELAASTTLELLIDKDYWKGETIRRAKKKQDVKIELDP
jgi:hypothetical protein|mmetsp:Transcript_64961/g.101368  ORF Transcript_64961/g.101368 Transcript_64961/m.101368 type:complete len:221 (+) Transcript_64961:61-723(+)